jgi:hypothetical protein
MGRKEVGFKQSRGCWPCAAACGGGQAVGPPVLAPLGPEPVCIPLHTHAYKENTIDTCSGHIRSDQV